MRDIKFRGKRFDNGEWAYGFYGKGLIDVKGDEEVYRHFIMVWDVNGYFTDHIVDPETVGQYTGLKDKNGVDVYEEDLRKDVFGVKVVEWKEHKKNVCYGHGDYVDEYYYGYIFDGYTPPHQMEVIGNTHDNAGLLP